jgi:hypothetical protein
MHLFAQTVSGDFSGFSAILFLSVLVFGLFLGVFTLMFPLIFLVAKLKKKAEYYENLRETAVIAQYQPPHNLSPAEVWIFVRYAVRKKRDSSYFI